MAARTPPREPEVWKEIDDQDKKTPDSWVARHPSLVRLTGKHPFNCEPSLSELMRHGHETPASLHYVRNHGAVPIKADGDAARQAVYDSWTLTIDGVDNPITLSMADLEALPRRELPVLLVCAGNRRKEQNMVNKTIGFNWGPSGCGVSRWGGVLLSDVLALAKAKFSECTHVHFDGPEGELPKGDDGSYGTSLTREHAFDPANDVLIAFLQNGERLQPDHGFPLRLIIPGFIGGRMIKWLKKITVARQESQNFYHFRDNRVLPVGVTPESAESEGWWFKPDYIINELNIQSVISQPAHGETFALAGVDGDATYAMAGYAYSGGGRKVIRVEVSLDGGATWTGVDTIEQHPAGPTAAGKWWNWCFWRHEVSVAALMRAGEVRVRAWDSAMNTQPENLTWNVMGMLNNPHFRVRVHRGEPAANASGGGTELQFEHPTLPGAQLGGWMTPEAKPLAAGAGLPPPAGAGEAPPGLWLQPPKGGAPPAAAAKPAGAPSGAREITLEELARHNTEDDCWIAVKGKVYDATAYVKTKAHPGGNESILMNAGEDVTEEFGAIHSPKAWAQLEPFLIGILVEGGARDDGSDAGSSASSFVGSLTRSLSSSSFSSLLMGEAPAYAHDESMFTSLARALSSGSLASLLSPAPIPVALNSTKKKITLTLAEKKVVTDDIRVWRFALPEPQMKLGLPCGKHILMYLRDEDAGELVVRAYTPLSNDLLIGFVDLAIRVYRPLPPRFPDGGRMTQLLDKLPIGGTIEVRGPIGEIEYLGDGCFVYDGRHFNVRKVSLIAGGTGITPVYQLIKAMLDHDDPESYNAVEKIALLYGNQDVDTILCKAELDDYAAAHPERFHLHHTVAKAPPPEVNWPYSVGFADEKMMREQLPEGGHDGDYVFLCGPPPMIKAVKANLAKMGYDDAHVLTF